MPFAIIAYLCLGVVFQCALFTPKPDWQAGMTWAHVLLWPGFLGDFLAGFVHLPALQIPWLTVALAALLLVPFPGIWLAFRQARSRERSAGIRRAVKQAREQEIAARERTRIEPRFVPFRG